MAVKEYKHGINVKIPLNLFTGLWDNLQDINFLIAQDDKAMKKAKDPFLKEGIRRTRNYKVVKQKAITDKIRAIYTFLRIKGFDYNRNIYPDKEFTRIFADNFNQTTKSIRTYKDRLIKAGYAKVSGDLFIMVGNEHVWKDAGLLVEDHKFDEEGKRIKIKSNGVYTLIEYEHRIVKRGEQLKNGNIASRDIIKDCEKKIKVPIIKLFLNEDQLRDENEFRKAIALAMIKRLEDHDNSKSEPKQRKDANDGSMEFSSKWFARQLGYSATASGWHLRNDLQDCGFISITEVKQIVEENIDYLTAKEKYPLQKGIDESTGLAYYFKNNKVFGVNCFRVKCNGYIPVTFPRKKQRKKSKFVNYIVEKNKRIYTEIRESFQEKKDWIVKELKSLEGMTFRQIYLESLHLIETLRMTGTYLSDNYFSRPGDKLSFSEISDLVVADGYPVQIISR